MKTRIPKPRKGWTRLAVIRGVGLDFHMENRCYEITCPHPNWTTVRWTWDISFESFDYGCIPRGAYTEVQEKEITEFLTAHYNLNR